MTKDIDSVSINYLGKRTERVGDNTLEIDINKIKLKQIKTIGRNIMVKKIIEIGEHTYTWDGELKNETKGELSKCCGASVVTKDMCTVYVSEASKEVCNSLMKKCYKYTFKKHGDGDNTEIVLKVFDVEGEFKIIDEILNTAFKNTQNTIDTANIEGEEMTNVKTIRGVIFRGPNSYCVWVPDYAKETMDATVVPGNMGTLLYTDEKGDFKNLSTHLNVRLNYDPIYHTFKFENGELDLSIPANIFLEDLRTETVECAITYNPERSVGDDLYDIAPKDNFMDHWSLNGDKVNSVLITQRDPQLNHEDKTDAPDEETGALTKFITWFEHQPEIARIGMGILAGGAIGTSVGLGVKYLLGDFDEVEKEITVNTKTVTDDTLEDFIKVL